MADRSDQRGEQPGQADPRGQSDQSDRIRIDPPTDFAPQEDGYERLWTPQRMSYVLGKGKKQPSAPSASRRLCPFCEGPKKSDKDALICWRGTYVFAVMNLYPYNTGHLMICPYRHVPYITDLSDDELFEFEKATTLAMAVMKNVSHPDGWNIGINQGAVAGAGVADHLHQHIVPRWNGDANFMPIIAQTRTMPVLLGNQRDAYAAEFDRLAPQFALPLSAQKQ